MILTLLVCWLACYTQMLKSDHMHAHTHNSHLLNSQYSKTARMCR